MSLFERISNRITEEKKNQRDNSYLFDDDKDSSNNKKKPNQNKKFSKNIESGRTTYNKNQKSDQEIGQRRTAQDRQQQLYNRQYDAYDDGDLGNPDQSKSQTSTTQRPKKREVKKIMNQSIENQKKAAERAKRFRQSFGTPTGADPKTGKPFYGGSTVSGKAGPDIDLPKGRGGGIPTDKAYEKQAKRLGDREAAKKTYIDPKTYKASKEGTKAYIRKSLQMKTGSNVPVDDKEVNKIFKKSGKEYADKINQKYGGKRTRVEREIKTEYQKEIDRRAKSSKKIGGKSFDDLIKDAKKNNKVISQDIAKLKTKSFVPPKTTPLVTPPLKTPPKTIPLTQPLKEPKKIKKILSTKTPAYNPYKSTSRFKKVMTALKKNPKTALAAAAIGTGIYLYNRGKNNPKGIVPPPSNKGKIRGAKGVDIKFTLGGGDPSKGFKYAGRTDTNK